MTECPKCQLPREESAWQCDGCGFAFRTDFEVVRAELKQQIRSSRVMFWVSIIATLVVGGGLVLLGLYGFIYISVPLGLMLVGSIGHAAHRTSVLREHLESLDRRHRPLPTATARIGASNDKPL